MRVLILGSGVIGTTVAYYLARAGHDVEVVDRQGRARVWRPVTQRGRGVRLLGAVGRAWRAAQGHSVADDAAQPAGDQTHAGIPAMWRWGAAMLRNCTEARYRVNKGRMVRLAEYSRDCLKALRADIGIQYDDREQGTLQLFRTQKQLTARPKTSIS